MEDIEVFLRKLRESQSTRWVASEVDETLSQGVSMNVKEADEDGKFNELILSQNLPAQERNKRQKYETSRAFTDEEKIEVILKAFEVIYLDLPAIRKSAIENLTDLDANIEAVVFSSADEEISEKKIMHDIKLRDVNDELNIYKDAYMDFTREITQ